MVTAPQILADNERRGIVTIECGDRAVDFGKQGSTVTIAPVEDLAFMNHHWLAHPMLF